ncbi:ABC transporter permease [Brevibacterium litoralis]|uniref:ABC transporter permease n=1 Tax=Brevibacterium litoralis TaxID=3138935 RepID=UPI0032EBD5E7
MQISELAAQHSLHRVGARPSFFRYLGEVWKRRDFTYSLARYRIKSDNERNRLGMLWVLLRPILSACVYGLVFGLILGDSRPPNFIPFLVIGVFVLEFFNSSMNGGAKSIISNASLVQSLPFPRAVLPVAKVFENLLNFMPTLLLMFIITMLWGARPSWDWFLFIPLIGLFWMFNQGIAFIFARLTVHLRDLSQLIPFISRLIFYTSGVFYEVKDVLSDWPPAVMAVYSWHPLHETITIARGLLLQDYEMPWDYWWMLAIWAVVTLIVGALFFWKAEERYGREE